MLESIHSKKGLAGAERHLASHLHVMWKMQLMEHPIHTSQQKLRNWLGTQVSNMGLQIPVCTLNTKAKVAWLCHCYAWNKSRMKRRFMTQEVSLGSTPWWLFPKSGSCYAPAICQSWNQKRDWHRWGQILWLSPHCWILTPHGFVFWAMVRFFTLHLSPL